MRGHFGMGLRKELNGTRRRRAKTKPEFKYREHDPREQKTSQSRTLLGIPNLQVICKETCTVDVKYSKITTSAAAAPHGTTVACNASLKATD